MARRRRPPSQGWKTFLRNHADGIASIDMFVVPTISFQQLYGLLVLRHSRRELLWLGVTIHPSAEWIARQLTEACGWDEPVWSKYWSGAFRLLNGNITPELGRSDACSLAA
jgi:hypothetical protein